MINRITELLLQLSAVLEKIEGVDPNDLWQLHPDREAKEPFKEAKALMDEIITRVKKLNPEMLSDETILTQLLYEVATYPLQISISEKELEKIAIDKVNRLINFRSMRNVDIPIVLLDVGDHPFKMGPVTFYPISEEDKLSDWWERIKSNLNSNTDFLIKSYARVYVPGDISRAIDAALRYVRETILLIRGIGYPITTYEKPEFGIINDFSYTKSIYFRLDQPDETVRIDYPSKFVEYVGPFIHSYRITEDILSNIPSERLNAFQSAYNNVLYSKSNQMQLKIISGFRWLGEATKSDPIDVRYVKLALSLEAFIGGDVNDETLTSKGITAMLAERAAFLLGKDLTSRKDFDRTIRKYYKLRSDIAHGRSTNINGLDFENFGKLVREIGFTLVDRINKVSSVDDLQNWVVEQRYS